MLRSLIHVETRREVAFGTAAITAISVGLSVLVTYLILRGGDPSVLEYGLLISSIVPIIVAPLASGSILEVLRENFLLNQELKLAAKVAERLAIAESAAKARQSANEALEAELAERRHIEAKLRESNTALERANAVKTRFLTTINRELRAPMVEVLDLIDELDQTEVTPQQAAPLADLQRRSIALFTTVNDVLDLSQLEAAELSLQMSAFDLATCAEDCVEVFAKDASRKGVEIVLNIAPSVPWRVVGDQQRLRQVLENLIGNAVKFTHRGRIEVTVAASTGWAGRIRFDVSDTGIGFSDEARALLFEAFGATGSAGTSSGAGLGLVISQHLVGLMKGEMSIDSQPGKGTVVSFTAEFGTVSGATLKAATDGLRDARVFLATNRSSTRHQIGTYLTTGGASYDCASSTADVLTGLRQGVASRNPFHAVILDLSEENAALAQSIEAHAAFDQMKIIAIASPRGAMPSGRCITLARPVLPDQLLEAIVDMDERPREPIRGRARRQTAL